MRFVTVVKSSAERAVVFPGKGSGDGANGGHIQTNENGKGSGENDAHQRCRNHSIPFFGKNTINSTTKRQCLRKSDWDGKPSVL